MTKIAIVEDHAVYQQELCSIISDCLGEEKLEIQCFASGEELLESDWQKSFYAAIFIDIILKNKNGMDTARTLRKNGYREMIIFTTNYSQFVYDGYEVEAFRYLLKPVTKRDIQPCVDRIIENVRGSALIFSFNRKRYSIAYSDILYISSYGHYLTIHTAEQDYEWKYLLKDLQPQLPKQFVRCHRSFIVNLDYMRKLDRNRIVLKNRIEIDVANGYLDSVRKAIRDTI